MLTQFMSWIRQMICLMIFLTILMQILPKKSYRGYVKFFAGLIFAAALLRPVISLLGTEDWEEEIVSRITETVESTETDDTPDLSGMEERSMEMMEEFATGQEVHSSE
ncbi:MAG: stage III sporulation protein AF [Clostridiales bacterium]|nr:stage III sporulation protein AF [Clostridiales bacterium]